MERTLFNDNKNKGDILNNVTKSECLDAIEYLFVEGFVDEMTSDKKYYTTILLKKVANDYNLNLIWEKEDN